LDLKSFKQHKNWMMLPALVWLFTQFAMSVAMAAPSPDNMQVTLCSPSGVQQITIDLNTGKPVKQISVSGCTWCQSFGLAVDVAPVLDAVPHYIVWADQISPTPDVTNYTFTWRVSGFQSRAPPL